ncbi:hypothetical protein PoB_006116300 [Plakobranchus ocellatus]|uniref:Uncharacterized protein n=1 Tax=Plakobranchus ocellatus TaxID=259542 RepID=A0AAV4CRZ0_9GAST|nr:hypothetical protein PoB_006116300 [Plakobranchus ocellatus]
MKPQKAVLPRAPRQCPRPIGAIVAEIDLAAVQTGQNRVSQSLKRWKEEEEQKEEVEQEEEKRLQLYEKDERDAEIDDNSDNGDDHDDVGDGDGDGDYDLDIVLSKLEILFLTSHNVTMDYNAMKTGCSSL